MSAGSARTVLSTCERRWRIVVVRAVAVMGGSVVCSSREGVSRINRMWALLRLDMLVRRVVVRWERVGKVRCMG